jgi:putative hydrolase of the HAD superfamily
MNIPTGVRAVVFDAVGTLIFPNPCASAVYAEVAKSHGIAISQPDQLSARLWAQFRIEEQIDRANEWRTGEARERVRWRNVVNAAIPGATDELFEELFQHFSQPSAWRVPDEAEAAIAELKQRGFILGMGSNYDERLRSVVEGIPALRPLAGHLVISSLVGYRKPSAHFFDAVRESVQCEPHEILFVGDDVENDIEGAKTAGMRALLVGDLSM